MTRCACKPSCLTFLCSSDTTVATPAGLALVEHLTPVDPYPTDGLTSLTSPLSKRGTQ